MRSILVAAAMAGALSVITTDAEAQYAPWCSGYNRGEFNCGWYTYQQCMDNIFGIGGWCYANPFVIAGPRYAPGFYDPGPVVVQRKRKLRRAY
jgi:Protein of unknown function (DUF3551)